MTLRSAGRGSSFTFSSSTAATPEEEAAAAGRGELRRDNCRRREEHRGRMGREEGARQGKEAGRAVAVEPRLEVGRKRLGWLAQLRTAIALLSPRFVSFLEGSEIRCRSKIFDKGHRWMDGTHLIDG